MPQFPNANPNENWVMNEFLSKDGQLTGILGWFMKCCCLKGLHLVWVPGQVYGGKYVMLGLACDAIFISVYQPIITMEICHNLHSLITGNNLQILPLLHTSSHKKFNEISISYILFDNWALSLPPSFFMFCEIFEKTLFLSQLFLCPVSHVLYNSKTLTSYLEADNGPV